jgi:hypothetical protein
MSPHERDPREARDASLEQAWREASRDEPPTRLDNSILAAAHRASAGRDERPEGASARRRPRPMTSRWPSLAAAAAVAGLAFVLVPRTLNTPTSITIPATSETTTPAPAPTHREQAAPATPQTEASSAPAPSPAPPQSLGDATSKPEIRERPNTPAPMRGDIATELPPGPVSADATPSTPAAAAPPPMETSITGNLSETLSAPARRKSTQGGASQDLAMPAAGAASSPSERREGNASAQVDAAAWAARIERLYVDGDVQAAARELRAFRTHAADADTWLPASLREWARTIE